MSSNDKSDGTWPLDIVVPCYNEEEALPETVKRLLEVLSNLESRDFVSKESRIIFVDDGSTDDTWKIISAAAAENGNIFGIKLAQNVGHQFALLAGLDAANSSLVLSIDADLQDDVNVIPEMIEKARAGADVVYGVRRDRSSDSWFKRFTAESYYSFLSLLGVNVVQNHADFRLMTADSIARLKKYSESNLYLRGLVPLVGNSTAAVFYTRKVRTAGETKYPLRKMLALAVDGVTSFSAVPLRFIALLGLLVFLFSFCLGLWVLWVRLFTENAIPGWASSLLPVIFLGGIQLLSLGVIGEYIAKIYVETKRRPRYFVESISTGEVAKSRD